VLLRVLIYALIPISPFDISVTYLGRPDPDTDQIPNKAIKMAQCSCIDDFRRCKVDVLKEYLKDRGFQNVSVKRKDELVALAFAAYTQNLPVTFTRDEKTVAGAQYRELLVLPDGTVIPDAFQLPADQWTAETDGVKLWPPCMILNITEYLVAKGERPLCTRLRNDYKEGE